MQEVREAYNQQLSNIYAISRSHLFLALASHTRARYFIRYFISALSCTCVATLHQVNNHVDHVTKGPGPPLFSEEGTVSAALVSKICWVFACVLVVGLFLGLVFLVAFVCILSISLSHLLFIHCSIEYSRIYQQIY